MFVSIATYIIIRYLKFPYKQFIDAKEKRRNLLYVAGFSFLAMLPSLFIFNKIYKTFKTEQNLKLFVKEYIGDDKIYLDEYDLIKSDSIDRLIMKVYGDVINQDKLKFYQDGLEKLNISNTKIEIIPTSEINLSNLQTLESKITGVEKLATQLEVARLENEKKGQMVEFLETEVAKSTMDSTAFIKLCEELKIVYPDINEVSISFGQQFNYADYTDKNPIMLISWNKSVSNKQIDQYSKRIENWIKLREAYDAIRIVSEKQ